MERVHFFSGSSSVVTPQKVALFRLLDPLGAVEVDLLRVCCEATRVDFTAVESSLVISAMISSILFFSVAMPVTLVVAASSSASMSSTSSSDSP